MDWVLDCAECGRPGDVVVRQDLDTGDLLSDEGTPAWEFVCHGCGSEDLIPSVVDGSRFARLTLPIAA